MVPVDKSKAVVNLSDSEQNREDIDAIPSKKEVLEGIRDGFVYVMSGGKGQPIDDAHREIAEELAREELADNAGIRR